MKKIPLCLMAFVLMISIGLDLHATEGGMETEVMPEMEEEIFDEIHPEDLDIQASVEEKSKQVENQNNQYKIFPMIILVINIICILHKIGINRKIIILFFRNNGRYCD